MSSVTSGNRLPKRPNVAFHDPAEDSLGHALKLIAFLTGLFGVGLVVLVAMGNGGVALLDHLIGGWLR